VRAHKLQPYPLLQSIEQGWWGCVVVGGCVVVVIATTLLSLRFQSGHNMRPPGAGQVRADAGGAAVLGNGGC